MSNQLYSKGMGYLYKENFLYMQLTLKRTTKKPTYTIGKLYIDGEYFCDTLEDVDRGLTQSMTEAEIAKIKVKCETAIPTGTYDITLNIVSPKYSTSAFYKENANGGRMPRLLNVPGFDGILIHSGNTDADSCGCLLVGKNTAEGRITSSRDTFKPLYQKLKSATDKITINIE